MERQVRGKNWVLQVFWGCLVHKQTSALIDPFTVFPNLAKGVAFLSLTDGLSSLKTSGTLLDSNGKLIWCKDFYLNDNQPFPLPIEHLSAGVYWLELLVDEDRKIVKKLILD